MSAPKLYDDLASWWPLFSPPEEYVQEAADIRQVLLTATTPAPQTIVELGSGGGSLAFHLKDDFTLTLVEPSSGMLAVSRDLNPECEHASGDMRDVRLGRVFDAVFIHDAVMYMLTEEDLRRALDTAFIHCRPGGVVLIAPDFVRETFQPYTDHGGHDGPARSLRYLEWVLEPDEADGSYVEHFAILLREGNHVRLEHDAHEFGLFARADWLRLLEEAGFTARIAVDSYARELFVGSRPED